ncbi:MAG: DUF3365 domain-containing protein [Cyanobacteria bacterium P01_A01_bin.84]
MLRNLKLTHKFTIVLIAILIIGTSVSGLALSAVLRHNAQREVTSTALLLMETMTSVREYTNQQVRDELKDKLETRFLPQSIPAYSATEVFRNLKKKQGYGEFFYKEATLNPTNPRDLANDFEESIVQKFRQDKNLKEWKGYRSLPAGDMFYIARPLAVSSPACLDCHSTPERAPKTQIELYGGLGGFGWKLNEIVGAQVISVPASRVINRANQSSFLIVGIVSMIFALVIVLVNIFLNRQVVRPLKKITRVAEEVSMGHMDVDFDSVSNDEIGNLAKAFKRMKLSLDKAMTRLKRPPSGTQGGSYGSTGGGRSTQ